MAAIELVATLCAVCMPGLVLFLGCCYWAHLINSETLRTTVVGVPMAGLQLCCAVLCCSGMTAALLLSISSKTAPAG